MLSPVATLPAVLPARRPELRVAPLGDGGQHVVKDPGTGDFFHLGEQEHFLLMQLDGRQTADDVRAAFESRFGEPLSDEDLDDFVQLARTQRLLLSAGEPDTAPKTAHPGALHSPSQQSILYWRKRLYDPDRLFSWLAPKLGFFWTSGFLVFSAGCIVLAAFTLSASGQELASSFTNALRWETAVWTWLMIFIVTLLHESAHGLTCKRYGGEVHDVGFLMMFFMPCFYCNVSDAWLFKEKSKRLWVTFAGGYCELFVWSLAVFAWRLTPPDTLPHYLSFVVLSACGIGTLFNFNPLLKLDGYYLLSDWLEVPNLQRRAVGYWEGHLRRLLWGAPRPEAEPRAWLLLGYGATSWSYSLAFLALMLWGWFAAVGTGWGWLGVGLLALSAVLSVQALLRGLTRGEVRKMITTRQVRTLAWVAGLGGVAAVLWLVEIEDRVGGAFRVRPVTRAELRAPVGGFLAEVYFDEGDRVSSGDVVARLVIPDLASRLAQNQAEVREAGAKLRLLEVGPRSEEVAEQRERVARAKAWCELARRDLTHTRQAFEEELDRLEKQVAARRAELDAAQDALRRARGLAGRKVLAEGDLQESEARQRVGQARLAEAQAARRAEQARGTRDAEAELARREKEHAEVCSALRLLEAGTRPEEVEAERARLARLQEERRRLEGLQTKQTVTASVSGVVTTPRLKEKVGQFLREGDPVGVVEELAELEAEVLLTEQDAARVRAGQPVTLKLKALPYETLTTVVDRVAPAAGRGEVQSSVTAYCRLGAVPDGLRSDMTGHARVGTGRRPTGALLLDRVLRYVRTEFWW
jgi:putative peptide zinc metalloprotease protein